MLASHGSKAKNRGRRHKKLMFFLIQITDCASIRRHTAAEDDDEQKKGKIMFTYNMQMIIKSEELSSKHVYERKREQV